jgi:hypothetical protein
MLAGGCMSSASKTSKLTELRTKTDRELAELIENELELGIQFAFLAQSVADEFESGASPQLRAEKIYTEAVQLLPKVDDRTEAQRLTRKLRKLRQELDRIPASELQAHTGSR